MRIEIFQNKSQGQDYYVGQRLGIISISNPKNQNIKNFDRILALTIEIFIPIIKILSICDSLWKHQIIQERIMMS